MDSDEAVLRCGITRRQLQWWVALGLIGHGRSDHRSWAFDDGQVLTIALIAELRRRGVSLHRVRHMPRLLPIAGEFLVTDGRRGVTWCGDPSEAITAAKRAPRPVLVVSIADLRGRIAAAGRRASGRKFAA